MTSINKTELVKRNDAVKKPTRKIHPINPNWLLNNKDSGYGSKLRLNGRPQTGVNIKRVGYSKTTTGDGKSPNILSHKNPIRNIQPHNENLIMNNKSTGGSQLFLRGKPQAGVALSKEKLPHISTRKIRERLIHMLCLKSYTKIELYSILQREGIREIESRVIPIVLREIAQVCKGAYSLHLSIWQEVDENWPYYTEQQLLQVKTRKERSLRPGEVTAITSSRSTSRTSPPQMHDNKPRSSGSVVESQPTKKIRKDHTTEPANYESESQPSKKMRTDYGTEPPNYDFSEYTEIINLEQRHQYKAVFDRYYEEYMPLWQQIDELKCSFRALGAQILDIPVDHPDYERIQLCIVDKFKRINSEEELKRKLRCDYLDAKLTHIKQRITLYDRKRREEAALAFAMAIANQYRQKQQHDDEEMIATPKCDEVPSTKHNGATKAPIAAPTVEYEYNSNIMTTDLALSDSDSDEEMITTPKWVSTKDDEAPIEAPTVEYEFTSNIMTTDLALSDSDSDEEMIARPKCASTKDDGTRKAPKETPPTKYDILTNDLALSDSDSDED